MRHKSHAAMGRYLLRQYWPELPTEYAKMFLLGCTQPDKNPATYLKGSIRSEWMRGHNYTNSRRFLMRLAARLAEKDRFTPWDFYSLGKLIHYTMDAFTYAHDPRFPRDLNAHHLYEVQLQHFFLAHLRHCRRPASSFPGIPAVLIRSMHEEYSRLPGNAETDTAYAFTVCCLLMQNLTENVRSNQEFSFSFRRKNAILLDRNSWGSFEN